MRRKQVRNRKEITSKTVNLPAIHVFHTKNNISRFILKGSVKGDNVRGIAVMPDLEFSYDLLSHILLGIHADDLPSYLCQQRKSWVKAKSCIPF